ncbi:MAG: site-2 protease family protein, partial [bacterium]
FKDPKRDSALVSVAGPLSNFTFAFALSLLLRYVTPLMGPISLLIDNILYYAVFINLALGVFNLLPLPPLDGSHILAFFLPPEYDHVMHSLERYGFILLVFIIWFPATQFLLFKVINLLYKLLFL